MIDIKNILKRSWLILWNYKILWIFGVLLVLATGTSGGNSGSSYQFSGSDYDRPFVDQNRYWTGPEWEEAKAWLEENISPMIDHPERFISTFIWIGVGLFLFILLLSVIFSIVRYVSETAILRMVDQYEQDGTKMKFKQGWKLGWTKRAFRLWVIDLIISLPILILVACLLGVGIYFSVSWVQGMERPEIGGMLALIGFLLILLLGFSLVMIFLGLLRQFFARFAVLDETKVGESFRQGWMLFKHQWKSASLLWLVMLGIGIGFSIVSLILFFLLIPVYIVLLIPGVIVAAIPGLIAFGISSLFTGSILSAIIGGVIALPFLFTVLFSPLYLISAWYKVFDSSVWTLTYRELKVLERQPVVPEPVVLPDDSQQ
jgi:hypothetical protein